MWITEYYEAKKSLGLQRKRFKKLGSGSQNFRKEFIKLIEASITVHGHAWAMDVKNERKKMAKLFWKEVEYLKIFK